MLLVILDGKSPKCLVAWHMLAFSCTRSHCGVPAFSTQAHPFEKLLMKSSSMRSEVSLQSCDKMLVISATSCLCYMQYVQCEWVIILGFPSVPNPSSNCASICAFSPANVVNFIVRLHPLPQFAETISQGYRNAAVTPGL